MALVTQGIKSFVSGISQQPPVLRSPEHLEEQVNLFSSEVGGLQKRPPTVQIAALSVPFFPSNPPFCHFIDNESGEKYLVMVPGDGRMFVWDSTGQPKDVTFEQGASDYITVTAPRYAIRAVTIADYTFITNTDYMVAMSSEISPDIWKTQGALVHIKSGQYGRTYTVKINGAVVASYTTPDGSNASHSSQISTTYIANQLATAANASGWITSSGEGWLYINKQVLQPGTNNPPETAAQLYNHVFRTLTGRTDLDSLAVHQTDSFAGIKQLNGDTVTVVILKGYQAQAILAAEKLRSQHWRVEIERTSFPELPAHLFVLGIKITYDVSSFTDTVTAIKSIETSDGFGNAAMFGIFRTVQRFSNLPAAAPDGFVAEVQGEPGSSADNYYVRYDATSRTWKETIRPGVSTTLNPATMPHTLVRNADGSFTLRPAEWVKRTRGDDDSNPEPSFVGQPIRDLFFFMNRLGFIAGENIILTKTSDFFQFWMSTATDILDTDPIDVAVSHNKDSTLYHAVPFNRALLLFSKNAQFLAEPQGILSPKTFSPQQSTEFENSPKTRPVGAGRNVYFISERALHSSVKEYYLVQDGTDTRDAQDVSSHVPDYIPKGIYRLLSSTNENILVGLTEGAPNKLFIYKYLFQDESRMQSSWSVWEITGDTEIIDASIQDSSLYLVTRREGEVFLERMDFTQATIDFPHEPYRVYMDRKVPIGPIPTVMYDTYAAQTLVNIQEAFGTTSLPEDSYGIVFEDGYYQPFTPTDLTEGVLKVPGNYTGKHAVVGCLYTARAVFSPLIIRGEGPGGQQVAVTDGVLYITSFSLNFGRSGYFTITVDRADADTSTEEVNSEYSYEMTARILGDSSAIGKVPQIMGTITIPVHGRNDRIQLTAESTRPVPFALISAYWTGNYHRRAKRI